MSEAKHTPGLWFTHRTGFSTVYIEARIGGGMLQEVAACGPTAEGSEQQEANARLIAAAPELLEALIEAEKKLVELERMVGGGDGEVYVEGAILNARAAISKATSHEPSQTPSVLASHHRTSSCALYGVA